MKNKILLFILAILIFTPTVFSIIYYNTTENDAAIVTDATTLSIRDPEGMVYNFTKGESEDADAVIDMFAKMKEGAEKKVALPDSISTSGSFTVIYKVGDKETKYLYYLSKGADMAYFLDPDGIAYQIKSEDAALFLQTSYAQSIYNDSKLPSMVISGGQTVRPFAATWMYKNTVGTFVEADTAALVTSAEQHYDLKGALSLEFSDKPDSVDITVTNDAGENIYTGAYDSMSALNLEEGANISVSITAKWFEAAESTFYGDLSYAFTANMAEGAEFYLALEKNTEKGVVAVQVGEFISITGMNIDDPSKITFTSEPSIDFTPSFVKDEAAPEYVRALVPFKTTLTPGNYTFTLGYEGVSQPINVELLAMNNLSVEKPYNISKGTIEQFYTENAIENFKTTTSAVVKNVTGTKQWDGYFHHGFAVGNINCGFGYTRKLTNSDGISYTNLGVDYSVGAGTKVPAANGGTVVLAEPIELTGYTVIIDHGFGLYTWYCNLAEISVKVGDTVKREDPVGIAGQTGFTSHNGVFMAMTVCGEFVCPYSTWVDGDWKTGVPMYTK